MPKKLCDVKTRVQREKKKKKKRNQGRRDTKRATADKGTLACASAGKKGALATAKTNERKEKKYKESKKEIAWKTGQTTPTIYVRGYRFTSRSQYARYRVT